MTTPTCPDAGRKTILLADDDAAVRTMLGRVLEGENYEVVLARDGREAAARFREGPPDLVLLDLNMPGQDGWEALRLMNRSERWVPVIVITARPHQYPEAVRRRIDALMEKPLDLPVLLDSIRRFLAEPDQARALRAADPKFKTALLSAVSLTDARN